jgi:DEAD/DEAH box helicase domain-containing protein
MSIETALQALRLEPRFMANVARWVTIPDQPARYGAFPNGLEDRLVRTLSARGVSQIYTHQAEAIEAALRGEHVAIVSPAASGKTLCYNLPVLDRLLRDPQARALYLFPTKALAQDQLAELRAFMPLITCATYDGDTPSAERAQIRDAARIVLSNPDMLHAGILPQHTRWAGFFSSLRAIVLDEMHVYRGVFGSHVANVLRRLRRVCRFYGGDPQFILASATIANPADLTGKLIEAPVTLIGPDRNGAPQREKQVLFYNPPLQDPALGIRRSSSLEAADLAAHFLAHDVQTILFAPARLTVELMVTYLRDIAPFGLPADLSFDDPTTRGRSAGSGVAIPRSAIRGYRGGYLPSERREIERGLREGKVRCVVATNALELGIDIGQLDAALLVGYPGTIASTRQQMGRAGRRQSGSVAVLIATPAVVDQYIVRHPEYVLIGSNEHALINPDNEVILAGHLTCSAAELPIGTGEPFGEARDIGDLLADLVEAGQLYRAANRFYWAGTGYPAAGISLRSSSPDRIIIQTSDPAGKPAILGEVDRFSGPRFLYEGAIYLHEGAPYSVERLDWNAGIAIVHSTDVDYYTRPTIGEKIEILTERQTTKDEGWRTTEAPAGSQLPAPVFQVAWGDVRVVSQATGYKIIRRTTHELLGLGTIDLPEQVLETQACWLAFPERLIEQLKADNQWLSDPNDYGPLWASQRDAARARSGYRCEGCGTPEAGGRQHDVHHRTPFRAFVADPELRGGLPADEAWKVANRPDNLVTLCPICHHRAEAAVRMRSGLGGMAALLAGVAPLRLMCDPRDLGFVVEPRAPNSGLPTVTIYEKVSGGVGYAREMYDSMPELLSAAYDLVSQCPCERGCPSCVGPILEHEYALDSKLLASAILKKYHENSKSA